jgi:Helix-turn-helix domain
MRITDLDNLMKGAAPSTGNFGLDALVDCIAARVAARLLAAQPAQRLMDVKLAAEYIGRSPAALRHMIAKALIPSVRRDGRVYCDRKDLDQWIEIAKA